MQSQVKSLLHSPGDYILLSADKYEIKVRCFFSLINLLHERVWHREIFQGR